jgi:tripartite-type tricarboxylate transporter receptor subunit TctC
LVVRPLILTMADIAFRRTAASTFSSASDILMKAIRYISLCLCCALYSSIAVAEDYPNKTVRIVVPFTPGGNADPIARLVAAKLSERAKGVAFIVENRAGAAGTIGADAVMNAPRDGYTVLFGNSSSFSVIPLMRKVSYAEANGLVPVAKVADYIPILAARPELKVTNLQDMILLARKSPQKYTYGSVGPGSISQVAFETIKQAAEIEVMEVPYKGSGEVINAMLSDQIDFTIDALAAAQIRQGKLVGLAVLGNRRHPGLPGLPTVAEAGLRVDVATGGIGLFLPAAAPKEASAWLETALREIVQEPTFHDTLITLNAVPEFISGPDFAAALQRGREINRGVLVRAGLEIVK